ncbi:MAG: MBL fold hydrolase [Bacteroidetes bacterium]|nr:MAG: MBL fold hydrolase [Bacteroidota bacterium]PTM12486.1 MAG: MBL fold hydrolase [Bacteroidota bacterium]
MAQVVQMTFNPFQENTYLVYDETGECVIFDPGCYDAAERRALSQKIEELDLKPVRLVNTHCHLDHVFGNKYVADTYKLPLEIHKLEVPVLASVPMVCQMYGLPVPEKSPAPGNLLQEGDVLAFGNTQLEMIFTPGHSPGSLSFYCRKDKFLIAGDVLFYGSIGRTDLPGGDHDTLIASIKDKLLPLGDDITVYSGHGPATRMGYERKNNPFL